MPKFIKGDVVVDTNLSTEIVQLQASGFTEVTTAPAAEEKADPESTPTAPARAKRTN